MTPANNRPPRRAAEGGFTLLELLTALAVLGFLMIGLSQATRTGLDLWGRQTQQLGRAADLDATARTLRGLLSAVPLLPNAPQGIGSPSLAISFAGATDRLNFTGDLPTGLGASRRADITISLSRGRLVLLWAPHRHEVGGAAPPPTETELLRQVEQLEFAYWGVTGPGVAPAWLPRWDGPAMPQLIRIRLGFPRGDPRHWPDLIVAPELAATG